MRYCRNNQLEVPIFFAFRVKYDDNSMKNKQLQALIVGLTSGNERVFIGMQTMRTVG